ncbi:MAG TPA: M28 family peptidase, partial [Thermoanaerobaculia bacterium]
FAFMVSLKQARAWQQKLAGGTPVELRASVRAGQHPGAYSIATAVLPGADPALSGQQIVLSCHLDHLRPGANDNASGCATILEVGRTLAKLVREGKIAPPRRTIRFVWPPEVEGSIALLNAHPEIAKSALAVVHMDMVGGDAEITKAVFHVTRTPKSLPTFVNDVGEAFGRFVNAQSDAYASTGAAAYPLVDPEGGKRALEAAVVDFTEGSDHEVWSEGSWRVPAIYLNDWPDRYIHTDADRVGNIDPTKLLRAGFIGAASAYYMAQLDASGASALWEVVRGHALERTATALSRAAELRAAGQPEAEAQGLLRFSFAYEKGVAESLSRFVSPQKVPDAVATAESAFLAGLERLVGAGAATPEPAASAAEERLVYRRRPEPKGPMAGFGYNYLDDKIAKLKIKRPALLARQGLWGGGALYAYEALNLVDGRRNVRQVRDALAAIYGPLPVAEVAEMLDVLAKAGVLEKS